MKRVMASSDPDILGSFAALRRASRSARRLALKTATPFYVWQGGRVVDLNPVRLRPAARSKRAR